MQFSPVTSDSGGDDPGVKQAGDTDDIDFQFVLTSETPCATEESSPYVADVDLIECIESGTPRRQHRKS